MALLHQLLLFCLVCGTFGITVYDEVIEQKLILGSGIRQLRIDLAMRPSLSSQLMRNALDDIEERGNNLHTFASLSNSIQNYFPHRDEFNDLAAELSVLQAKSGIIKRDLDSDYAFVFRDFPLTAHFVACTNDSSCNFITELLGSGRTQIVGSFTNLTKLLNDERGWDIDAVDVFLREITAILYVQTQTNPPAFVSHGTDHSVRVMGFASVLSDLDEVAEGMNITNYVEGVDERRWALMLHGLLHDIGYTDIAEHKVPKWLHSTAGYLLASKLLGADSNYFGGILLENITEGANLTEAFLTGILQHNLDDGQCLAYPNLNDSCRYYVSGDPNVYNSPTTPLLNNGGPYYRTFTRASPILHPFTFVIRIADNLDAQYSRLSEWQQDTNLMRFLKSLYTDADIRTAVGSGDKTAANAARAAGRDFWRTQYALRNDSQTEGLIGSRADEQSFLHFYSNWIIKNIDFDLGNMTLKVDFRDASDGVPDELLFDKHWGPGLYQINRLALSMNSLDELRGGSILAALRIVLMDIDPTAYLPLEAFTHATAYNTTGPTYQLCQAYCNGLTLNLTASIEPCVNRSLAIVPCPASFTTVSPFSDLYYPNAVNITTSSSSSIGSSVSGTSSGASSGSRSSVSGSTTRTESSNAESSSSRNKAIGLLLCLMGMFFMFA